MGVCLHHIKAIVRKRFFFIISPLFVVKDKKVFKKLPINQFPHSWQVQWGKF